MNDNKKDFFDIASELDGLAAILSILSLVYLDSDNYAMPSKRATGEAIFGAECLAKRIAQDMNESADKIWSNTFKK